MELVARTTCFVARSIWSDVAAIHAAVRRLTKDTQHREMRCLERRTDTRLPFQRPVHVRTLRNEEQAPDIDGAEIVTAYTRDIAPNGIGLLHDQPLASGRVLLTFELLGGAPLSLVAELTWCRYIGDFWHLSGGRLIGVATGAGQPAPARVLNEESEA